MQLQSWMPRSHLTSSLPSAGPPRQDLGALPQPAGRASQKAETLAAARPHAKLTGPRPARVFKVPLDVRALIESDDEEVSSRERHIVPHKCRLGVCDLTPYSGPAGSAASQGSQASRWGWHQVSSTTTPALCAGRTQGLVCSGTLEVQETTATACLCNTLEAMQRP